MTSGPGDEKSGEWPNVYFVSAGFAVLLLFALLMFVLSWLIGGNQHLESMGGSAGLGLVVVALMVSAVTAVVLKPKD